MPIERLGVTIDCRLPNMLRMIAAGKLRALAEGAAIVGAEHAT